MSLKLYLRPECGLCEEALGLLTELQQTALEVDVEADDVLMAIYGLRIPVLTDAAGRELDWPFDSETLAAFLDG